MKRLSFIVTAFLVVMGLYGDGYSQLSNWELYLALSTTGGGGGAKYRRGNPEDAVKTFSFEISGVRGDKEFTYVDQFGYPQKLNQKRYMILIPMTVGYQKRLFKDTIEDNFRPFYHLELGPVLGLRFPVGHGFNGNIKRGKTGLTFGGFVGVGVEIMQAKRNSFILAAGYRIATFPNKFAADDETKKFNAFMIRFGIITH